MSVKYVQIPHVKMLLLILLILISGCANPKTISKATQDIASPVLDEVPKNVKVTEFILGAGDKVEIIVYRHDDLKRTIQIDTSGKITYPLVGEIQAGGSSIFQLRDKIRDGLSKYIINPDVSVGVITVLSHKVVVLGEVKKPGSFSLDTPLTAAEAVSKAGGFTTNAKQKMFFLSEVV
jgi:polysaccharide biosynthesis/export protein